MDAARDATTTRAARVFFDMRAPDDTADLPLILLVDDYQDSLDMYEAFLTLSGFRVIKATNGAQALRLASEAVPDLILMDLSLPGIDGFEVTRRLKEDDDTRAIPVVALTASALPLDPALLAQQGFESLLRKPCPPDVLAEEVSRHLAASRALPLADPGVLVRARQTA